MSCLLKLERKNVSIRIRMLERDTEGIGLKQNNSDVDWNGVNMVVLKKNKRKQVRLASTFNVIFLKCLNIQITNVIEHQISCSAVK